jgi:O-antigen ligase
MPAQHLPEPESSFSALSRAWRRWHEPLVHPASPEPTWVAGVRAAYVACGCVLCFCSVGSMAMVELGGLPALVLYLVLLPRMWRLGVRVFLQPVVLGIIAWAAWIAISLLWSPDRSKGVWELGTSRFGWFIIVLWPMLRHRRSLIVSLALGFLASNGAQLALALVRACKPEWDFNPRYPDRNPGWWVHPTICGYMLVAAVGLHIPGACLARGRGTWLARAALVVTWMGILATGTRGAFLAGGALTVAGALAGFVSRWRNAQPAKRLRLVGGMLLLTLAGALIVAGVASSDTSVGNRMREGIDEVSRFVQAGDVSTFTGARAEFAAWAWEQFREHPLRGVGAGGYEASVHTMLAKSNREARTPHIPPQAHNTFLHAAATLGLVGLAIGAWVAWGVLRGAYDLAKGRWATRDAGPFWALLGMLAVTPFDVLYVNSPPSALLAVLFALSLPAPGSEQRRTSTR